MRLADGRPIGEIEVLRHSSGLYFSLLGVSDTGDVYYNANRVSFQPTMLHIAPFETATQQIGSPAAVATLASGLSVDWSPDSKSIAYARSDETKPTIVIRDAATALEHKIQLPDDSIASPYYKSVRLIRWSPQGKILAHASGRNYLIDPDETSVRRLELTRDPFLISAEWASDGWTVLYQSVGSLRGVDVGTGLQTESHTLPEFLGPVEMSPQQRLVAFSKPQGRLSEIDVTSLDDGVPGPLVVTDRRCRPAGWWNREVFVACDNDSNKPNVSPLYLVDVGSGTMKTTHVNLQGIEHVRVRPDGRAIAITAGLPKPGTFALKVPRR
jgi:Tol biopolymer transport system component